MNANNSTNTKQGAQPAAAAPPQPDEQQQQQQMKQQQQPAATTETLIPTQHIIRPRRKTVGGSIPSAPAPAPAPGSLAARDLFAEAVARRKQAERDELVRIAKELKEQGIAVRDFAVEALVKPKSEAQKLREMKDKMREMGIQELPVFDSGDEEDLGEE